MKSSDAAGARHSRRIHAGLTRHRPRAATVCTASGKLVIRATAQCIEKPQHAAQAATKGTTLNMKNVSIPLGTSVLMGCLASLAAGQVTPEAPMVRGDTPATSAGFTATP